MEGETPANQSAVPSMASPPPTHFPAGIAGARPLPHEARFDASQPYHVVLCRVSLGFMSPHVPPDDIIIPSDDSEAGDFDGQPEQRTDALTPEHIDDQYASFAIWPISEPCMTKFLIVAYVTSKKKPS